VSNFSDEAIKFIKTNKELIIEKFAPANIYQPFEKPVSLFMAGSPGAGKTEISKIFIASFEMAMSKRLGKGRFRVVRIDGDEIREMPLPGYSGDNSDLFQGAISIGVEKLIDHCFKKRLNMLVDSTFSGSKSIDNVNRSIRHGRLPYIIYVYQDPLKAWELTKAREAKEGRSVPSEAFVKSFFSAKKNVNEAKRLYGDKVLVDYIERDFERNIIKYEINIPNIDNYLSMKYTEKSLLEAINSSYTC